MLKLPKGLKKKKKGKKSKKDQELFTEEELEEYKKQLQQRQQQEQQQDNQHHNDESDAVVSDVEQQQSQQSNYYHQQEQQQQQQHQQNSSTENKTTEDDDEWSKFKALTAGVDSILHKTQDDLDRIKSTSFFKRVPPPSEKKKQEEEEAAALEAQRLEEERRKKEEEEANRDKLAEAVVELSESEEESENSDDIFDTAYIDAITSGEVQLAVVPDSPVLEVDDGPDPFDTSYADKLIKGPEVSKRGKKIVSIGSAVEVLTGKVDSAQIVASSGIKRKPRRGIQNLLLDNFDDDAAIISEVDASVTPEPPKTLLDDPADEIPNEPIDLSVSLHLVLQKEQKKSDTEEKTEDGDQVSGNPVDVISEFDVLKDDEDDEFAELAVESLTKKEEVIVLTQPQPLEFTGEVEGDWAQFEQQPDEEPEQKEDKEENKGKPKPPRPPPARPKTGPHISGPVEVAKKESDDEFAVPEDDPFDTTFVEKIVPKKEEEDDDDFDFDPRAGEDKTEAPNLTVIERDLLGGSNPDLTEVNPTQNLLTVRQKDLLGGSTTDLSVLPQAPILPVQESTDNTEDFDPFDTSAVTKLVQPKETELKFLEKELLEDTKLKHSLSDPDFDPRADESEIKVENNTPAPIAPTVVETSAVVVDSGFDPARRKSSLSLNLQQKSVAFLVPDKDLLALDNEGGKIQKPLTPYYTTEVIPEKEDVEDPFDTSFVPDSKPTKVELNLLEQDLLANPTLKHSLSDPDFDPRAEEEQSTEPAIQANNSDLLTVENQIDIKVLTPAQETNNAAPVEVEATFDDPFDTSSVAATILPGKTELKLIENELLPASTPVVTAVLDTQSDDQELGLGDKVLTPQIPIIESESSKEIDPFDTSFAENLGPGKTEIKILETELIQQ